MTEDDDMNYPMLNLHVLEKYGDSFNSEDIVRTWLEMLPILSTFTAERVAYVNYLSGIQPPHTALRRNPTENGLALKSELTCGDGFRQGSLRVQPSWHGAMRA